MPLLATPEWRVRKGRQEEGQFFRQKNCLLPWLLSSFFHSHGYCIYYFPTPSDPENNGYGHLTMQMIEDENVDLVVDVGDFDYWGRCTETYQVKSSLTTDLLSGQGVELPFKSTLKRIKWQDGRHGSVEGWEVGIQLQDELVPKSKMLTKTLTLDGELFQRDVVSEKTWGEINGNLKLDWGERDCYGEPWDGKHNYLFFPLRNKLESERY